MHSAAHCLGAIWPLVQTSIAAPLSCVHRTSCEQSQDGNVTWLLPALAAQRLSTAHTTWGVALPATEPALYALPPRCCWPHKAGAVAHYLASSGAGEDGDNIQPKLQMLHSNGIGGILDYAAEDDVGAEEGPASRSQPHDSVIARYASHLKHLLDCNRAPCSGTLNAAAGAPGAPCAAALPL